ncbi:MAG: hypothetical protein EPO42_10075 [Gallionellaceae bacterium]|nr:MAG: hypothetical protein EPO42_10075 [Gallionellaceae bacterium]
MAIVREMFKILLVVAGVLSTTALAAGQPQWIGDSSAEYPSSLYLVGRGVGATEEEAQNRARGDLATIFEVRVEVITANTTTATQSGKKEQVNKFSTQQVSAKTDKVISGINIAQLWRDPVTKDFHALAVLSRAQAGASLREELDRIDDEVQAQIAVAQAAQDPLLKVGALSHALDASIKRDGFQASLKIVDPSGRGIEAPVSQVSIQTRLDDILKRIRIVPEVEEDAGAKEFSSVLKGGLAAAGFLAGTAEQTDLVLVGKLALSDLGRQGDWNWVRASVEVALVEKASGRVRGSKTWPLKASAQDAKTARSRVLIEVEKLFKQELRAAIIAFAAS